ETGNVILAPVEDEFLTASRAAQQVEQQTEATRIAQQARQNKRLRRALVAAGMMLVIPLLAGSIAFVQRSRADDQRALANQRADATIDPARAALLAVEAYRRADSDTSKLQAAGAIQSVLSQQVKGVLGSITGAGPYDEANLGDTVIVAKDGDSVSVWDATSWKK